MVRRPGAGDAAAGGCSSLQLCAASNRRGASLKWASALASLRLVCHKLDCRHHASIASQLSKHSCLLQMQAMQMPTPQQPSSRSPTAPPSPEPAAAVASPRKGCAVAYMRPVHLAVHTQMDLQPLLLPTGAVVNLVPCFVNEQACSSDAEESHLQLGSRGASRTWPAQAQGGSQRQPICTQAKQILTCLHT